MAEHKHIENHEEHNHDHAEHHIVSIPLYLMVFGILIVGTILTYLVAFVDLDWIFAGANTLVALLIAFTKMTFVALWFMHVKYSSRLIWLTAAGLSHHGDKFALFDFKRNAAQCVCFHFPDFINLR
jgi:cytochrome c oxidase subunit 4